MAGAGYPGGVHRDQRAVHVLQAFLTLDVVAVSDRLQEHHLALFQSSVLLLESDDVIRGNKRAPPGLPSSERKRTSTTAAGPTSDELGRAVGCLLLLPRKARDGGEAHDRAAPVSSIASMAYLQQRNIPHHNVVPVLRRGVVYGAQGDGARVCDGDVYSPEALDARTDHLLRVLGARDVADDRRDLCLGDLLC